MRTVPPEPETLPEIPPAPPVFGLPEDAMSAQGDLEVATGNTLLVPADSIVQTAVAPLSADTDIAPVDYERPYLENVRKEVARHYPTRAKKFRLEGTVRLYLVLGKSGRVVSADLLSGSGHKALDQGVLLWLRQTGSFAPFPAGLQRDVWELEIPVTFRLR